MNCQQLAARIAAIEPAAGGRDVARLCLLMSNYAEDVRRLADEAVFQDAWDHVGLRLQAASDQHAAMTEELEHLADSHPATYSPQQIGTLLRAIKVQSQILALYLGQPQPEV
ncbi:MAG TPA: hypothetical protein VMF30_09450 [Pirellulales bacterium]|nr:hypothetical protein [Pirellulales bacterium]